MLNISLQKTKKKVQDHRQLRNEPALLLEIEDLPQFKDARNDVAKVPWLIPRRKSDFRYCSDFN